MDRPSLDELNLLHASVCQALGDPKRLLILYALAEQSRNVSALTEYLGMPQPTVSRHLQVLRERHLVVAERDGISVTYHLAEPRIIAVLDTMRQILLYSLARQSDLVAVPVPEPK